MIPAIVRWWRHVPEGYVTSNGFWVVVVLVLVVGHLAPALVVWAVTR